MRTLFFSGLLAFSSQLSGYQLAPWQNPLWEFYFSPSYQLTRQDGISTPSGTVDYLDYINTLTLPLELTVWPRLSTELEFLFTDLRGVAFTYHATRFTGKYMLWDELECAPFTATVGATVFQVNSIFLRSPGQWFPGNINGEFHLTCGKEWCRGNEWITRLWSYTGFGVHNRGNPYWHFLSQWEYFPSKRSQWALFSHSIIGMGNKNFNLDTFNGYGPVSFRFWDLGGRYRWLCPGWGNLEFSALGNIYAQNYPTGYWNIQILLEIPFGL